HGCCLPPARWDMRSEVKHVTLTGIGSPVEERAVDALDGIRAAVLLDVEDVRQRLQEAQPARTDPALELGRAELARELLRDGGGEEELGRGSRQRAAPGFERRVIPVRRADDDRRLQTIGKV